MKRLSQVLLSAIGVFALSGCHSAIMSDLSECPQYTVFTFDVHTMDDTGFPDSKIDDVRVFAFDENGKLVGEWMDNGVVFIPGYGFRTDYYRPGRTTFVAWAAKDISKYDFSAFKVGADQKDLLVFMAKQAGKIEAEAGHLYVGEPKAPLEQRDRANEGTFTDSVHFTLSEITNRLSFVIDGLEEGHTYTLKFTSRNSRYDYGGEMLPDETFEWTTDDLRQSPSRDGKSVTVTASYEILRLNPDLQDGYLMQILDETGRVVYAFDPLKDYILYGADDNPNIDKLDLVHDFSILINLRPSGDTYMAVSAVINNWNIVFRDVNL